MFADQVFIDPTFLCLWLRLLSYANGNFEEKNDCFTVYIPPGFHKEIAQ